jgi:hypothetical protein
MNKTRTLPKAAAALLFLLLGSCATQKTVMQYQDELRKLREERTQLKKENRDLRAQNEAYEVSLANANAPKGEPISVEDNEALGKVGVDVGRDAYGNYVISIPAEITFP